MGLPRRALASRTFFFFFFFLSLSAPRFAWPTARSREPAAWRHSFAMYDTKLCIRVGERWDVIGRLRSQGVRLPNELRVQSDYEKELATVAARPRILLSFAADDRVRIADFLRYLGGGNGGKGKAAVFYLDAGHTQRAFLPPHQPPSLLDALQVAVHSTYWDMFRDAGPAVAPAAAPPVPPPAVRPPAIVKPEPAPSEQKRIAPPVVARPPAVKRKFEAIAVKRSGDQGVAQSHYDSLKRTLSERHLTYILHLRNFNNFVKAVLIQRAGEASPGPVNVLDLSCGKGGDLNKWWNLGKVSFYTGVDIAKGSLEDLVERLDGKPEGVRCSLGACDLGKERLLPADGLPASSLSVWSSDAGAWTKGTPIPQGMLYEIASMQFALHYMFESLPRAQQLFQEVGRLLKPGGRWVVTTVDARVLVGEVLGNGVLNEDGSRDVSIRDAEGRCVCIVSMDAESCRRIMRPPEVGAPVLAESLGEAGSLRAASIHDLLGLRYTFELRDDPFRATGAAVNAPEWLAPLPAIEALAHAAGMKVLRARNFSELFHEAMQVSSHRALLDKMDVLDWRGDISPCTWRLARLYMALEIVKQ